MDAALAASFSASSFLAGVPVLNLSLSGNVTTSASLPGNAEGVFNWTILANDTAGNDTVFLKVGPLESIMFFYSGYAFHRENYNQPTLLGPVQINDVCTSSSAHLTFSEPSDFVYFFICGGITEEMQNLP
jgi:hypothetical protein